MRTNRTFRVYFTLIVATFAIQTSSSFADEIQAQDAARYIGKRVEVCGVVASATYAVRSQGQPTFLNLDQAYPNEIFTVLIWGSDRANFSYAPETLQGVRICVNGLITEYRGKPEIKVTESSQIRQAD